MPGDVCTISGRYLYDLGTTNQSNTWAQWQAKTQEEIEEHLRVDFRADAPRVRTDTRGTLILDMEGVASDDANLSSHPNELHTLSDANKAIVITEWKKRQAAVRAVFPNARITQYGVPIPVSRGDPANATWLARIAALVQAGTTAGYNGVGAAYDALDAISPILYARFGPSDADIFWLSYDDQAETCLDGAETILKSDGSSILLLPLVNTYVANGSSDDNDLNVLDLDTPDPIGSTWGIQFPIFRAHGIAEVVVWNGINSRFSRGGSGPSTHKLARFIHAGKGW